MHNSLNKIKDNILNLPTWLVIGLAGCIIAVESALFLFPEPLEFPMDDAYIHFVYADNLISHGKLFFSDMNEIGVATTSPLWVFLLAGLKLLGMPLPISAKIMGAIGLTVVSGGVYALFRPVWKSPSLLLAVFLVAISGNLVWFSLKLPASSYRAQMDGIRRYRMWIWKATDQPAKYSLSYSNAYVLPVFLITALVLILTFFFIFPEPQVFPMGDSYIHFVYARNLYRLGEFTYNPGIVEGIGTTSPLWVFILAVFLMIGISPLIGARILGVGLLIAVGILCFDLAFRLLQCFESQKRHAMALMVAMICVASGNFLWIALSGMETILFTAFGLLTLYAYSRERWLLAGVFLGFLALTRIEGVGLAAAILVIEILRNRRLSPQIMSMVISMCLLLIPWILYLQLREGVPFPTSFQGKRMITAEIERLVIEHNPWLGWIITKPPLVYITAWMSYTVLYMIGGVSMPGPALQLPEFWEGNDLSIPVISIVLFTVLIIPLLLKYGMNLWCRKHLIKLSNSNHRLVLVMFVWILLHNLAYAIYLPLPGAAGRYAPMNHLVFWSGILLSSLLLPNRFTRVAATSIVVLMLITSLQYWYRVYQANIHYMLNVRVAAAEYVDGECDPNKSIGTTDLGPLRYYAHQPIIDLVGFVNKDIPRLLEDQNGFSDYLLERDVGCLYVFMPVDNIGLDVIDLLKINDDPRFQIRREASFAVSLAEWSIGFSAVSNYMPSISIFRIIPNDAK